MSVPFGLFFGRLANFVNQELWGAVTTVPWAVRFQEVTQFGTVLGEPRHPSQLYEALLEGLVLFGILAQMTGLGRLFMDLATIVAGRFSGGPAKVCVVSSGMFGMISGSAVANAVTTGALTIPLKVKGRPGSTQLRVVVGGKVVKSLKV